MNPKAQQIAIAEICEWKLIPMSVKNDWQLVCGNDLATSIWIKAEAPTLETVIYCLPDYLNDLNAMREAENVLSDEQWLNYIRYLQEDVCRCFGSKYHCMIAVRHATATQLSEAFLRTFGKWNDD